MKNLGKLTLVALFTFQFLTGTPALAVGGYSQAIIVHNTTGSDISLYCKGGDQVIREKEIRLGSGSAQMFLADFLVQSFGDLLGGNYQCRISFSNGRNRYFAMNLISDVDISVLTTNANLEKGDPFICEHEPLNFNRPSKIISDLNAGGSYEGQHCSISAD